MPLRDPIFTFFEAGPVSPLEGHGVFQSADSKDVHNLTPSSSGRRPGMRHGLTRRRNSTRSARSIGSNGNRSSRARKADSRMPESDFSHFRSLRLPSRK